MDPFCTATMSATTELAVGMLPAPAPIKCELPRLSDSISTTFIAPFTFPILVLKGQIQGVTNVSNRMRPSGHVDLRAVATSLIVLSSVRA